MGYVHRERYMFWILQLSQSGQKDEAQQPQQSEQPQQPEQQPQPQSRPANIGRTAGTVARVGGAGTQVAGKGTKLAGKGVQGIGKGMQGVGRAASAIPVVGPVVGGALTAMGAGVQAAGKGVEAAGQGVEKTGQGISNIGKQLQKGADMADQLSGSKAAEIPGFGKTFPILCGMTKILQKVFMQIGLPIYILLLWPFESLTSFLGATRSLLLFRKLPRTTVWEVVTSLTIFCIWFGTLMVVVVIFACINSIGFFENLFMFAKSALTGSLDIDCGF